MYEQYYKTASTLADQILAENENAAASAAERGKARRALGQRVAEEGTAQMAQLASDMQNAYGGSDRKKTDFAGSYIAALREASSEADTEESDVTMDYAEVAPRGLAAPRSRESALRGYPMSPLQIEDVIRREAKLRNIDPDVAVLIYHSEGRGAYQSRVAREGKGSLDGFEASFGPYQLFTGGGLGNEYEKATGRTLINDNTTDGIVTQIQFALDKAATMGWGPWYGRKTVGVGVRDGLKDAKPIYNWRDNDV